MRRLGALRTFLQVSAELCLHKLAGFRPDEDGAAARPYISPYRSSL